MSISDRAMLARLSIRQWTARKLDKRITREVNRQYGAAANAGNYNKMLVDSPLLAAVEKVRGQAREFHLQNTLPWLDNGARILPAKHFLEYSNVMRGLRERFEAAAAEFSANYSQFVDDARRSLGDLFDPEDYPDRPVKPATQGTLEICRINAREIAIGRWRPRGNG